MRNRFRRNCATVLGAAKAVNVRPSRGRDLYAAVLLGWGADGLAPVPQSVRREIGMGALEGKVAIVTGGTSGRWRPLERDQRLVLCRRRVAGVRGEMLKRLKEAAAQL
jgi:hypothetical protein